MRRRADLRSATAGRGALDGYRRARRQVRRRRVEMALWLLLGMLGLVVVAGGGSRWWAGVAVVAAVLAVGRRPPSDPERWLRGAAGEVATARLLDGLTGRRWAVLHDRRVPGSRANLDHLVIGRRGVWVIDSKAWRGTVEARWRHVRVGDRRLDTSAVAWEASVVADRLGVEVRPLVVVHTVVGGPAVSRRRHLPPRGRRCDGVRVLPAAGLLRHLRRTRAGPRRRRVDIAALAALAAAVLPEM